jgi:hypothetical protein
MPWGSLGLLYGPVVALPAGSKCCEGPLLTGRAVVLLAGCSCCGGRLPYWACGGTFGWLLVLWRALTLLGVWW